MEFNLKNRPKWCSAFEGHELSHRMSIEEWFEGFEKELREKMAQLERTDRTAYGKSILKEILGEN